MTETGHRSNFGRIDADGTVYVKTAEGERAVGSWHAGTPEEGLAHFARRYADMATEVELLETRLASGATDGSHALATARKLRDGLAEAHVVGDLDALATRLDKVLEKAQQAFELQREERMAARVAAVARKEALIGEAEDLATNSTQWKAAGDRLRAILDEWKTIKGIDRKTDAELWKRYAAARDAFNKRRGGYFAGLDATRKQAQATKEDLVTRAEALSESTDWTTTAPELKALMTEWKELPRASREAEDRLWKRFRAAQDHFFTERSKVLADRDEEWQANQRRKEELLVAAEALDFSANPKQGQAQLRGIQQKWEAIGRVPRQAIATLDRRLRAVEDRLRAALDARWQERSPENPLLAQVREQVDKARQQLARAEASGDEARIRQAKEALATKQSFLDLAERAK